VQLRHLLEALPTVLSWIGGDVEIHGVAADSRRVHPGDLFIAIPGLNVDGHRFIAEAVNEGAVAVVGERPPQELPGLPWGAFTYVRVPDAREAWGWLCAAWHDYPTRQMRVVGVTGTDGKTTTVNLIHSILAAAGHKTGMISTVNAMIGDVAYDTGLHTTTPDALEVQRFLAQMVDAGVEYAVLEVTSHGLAQHRVTACDFDVAVMTNVTHEHLDYHGTYHAYLEAKSRLFHGLATAHRKPGIPKVAVLNADDNSFAHLRPIPADVHLIYGLDAPADVTAGEVSCTPEGITFVARTPGGDFPVRTPLLGRFNVYNVLAAIAVGVSQNVPFETMQQGIEAVRGVVGRMERIDLGQPFTVMVDFAHTPNSLQRALETVRDLTQGQVIVVFGCAGLRDRAKRPVMGEIAARLADRVVITAEDPRTEDLDDIMAQIAAGCEKAGRREGEDYWRIGDRAAAIAFAALMARPGDLVIVTGKGHEQSMCFGTTEYPWSDHRAVREALARL
jgi:UDP-N-acetylmuramoyl-L-alanyl-D-glutamate--2,6-diaminopimelate ligase